MSLEQALLRLENNVSTRAKSSPTVPVPEALEPGQAGHVQLPVWPDATRGAPNAILRSALFGTFRKGARRDLKCENIEALDGIKIKYTGERLDQGDLNLFLCLLHIARLQQMGAQCRFTAAAMLKMLGLKDTGDRKAKEGEAFSSQPGNRGILHVRLVRLMANAVEIRQGRYSYVGSLIEKMYKDEEKQEYIVQLNAELCALFGPDQFTQLDWEIRQALDGKPLAQWLCAFYASHAKPHPISIEALHRLCGSDTATLKKYAQTLRAALDAVADVSTRFGQPFSYQIQDGLVHIEKTPTLSQRRHLERRG